LKLIIYHRQYFCALHLCFFSRCSAPQYL